MSSSDSAEMAEAKEASRKFIWSSPELREEWIRGYAAACEAKLLPDYPSKKYLQLSLETERARSRKLIQALHWYATMSIHFKGSDYPDPRREVARETLFEYEASK